MNVCIKLPNGTPLNSIIALVSDADRTVLLNLYLHLMREAHIDTAAVTVTYSNIAVTNNCVSRPDRNLQQQQQATGLDSYNVAVDFTVTGDVITVREVSSDACGLERTA